LVTQKLKVCSSDLSTTANWDDQNPKNTTMSADDWGLFMLTALGYLESNAIKRIAGIDRNTWSQPNSSLVFLNSAPKDENEKANPSMDNPRKNFTTFMSRPESIRKHDPITEATIAQIT
jgi:hypothetical protein